MNQLVESMLLRIVNFLQINNGCALEKAEEGRCIVQDAFGFRYEVQVRPLSRINLEPKGLDNYGSIAEFKAAITNKTIV